MVEVTRRSNKDISLSGKQTLKVKTYQDAKQEAVFHSNLKNKKG